MRRNALRHRLRSTVSLAATAGLLLLAAACITVTPNPPWSSSCTLNVAILVDRSASIGDPAWGGNAANIAAEKQAVYDFILNALANRPGNVNLYMNAFATNVKNVFPSSGAGFMPIRTETVQNGQEVVNITGAQIATYGLLATPFAGETSPANYSDYGTGEVRGRTNWQGALSAVPSGANLVILMTDGDPTWFTGADLATNGGGTDQADIDKAIEAANALKQQGARIAPVHFGIKKADGPYSTEVPGVQGWERRLQKISGTTTGSDYFPSNYGTLTSTLQNINTKIQDCSPDLRVTKTANRTNAAPDELVTYTFTVTNTGGIRMKYVTVTDDVIGPIGNITSLMIDEARTFTATYRVPTGPPSVTNTVTVCGESAYNAAIKVCRTARHTLMVIPTTTTTAPPAAPQIQLLSPT